MLEHEPTILDLDEFTERRDLLRQQLVALVRDYGRRIGDQQQYAIETAKWLSESIGVRTE